MDPKPRRTDPVLLAIVGVVALLVILAVVTVLTRDNEQRLDATSPEGVVQRFVTALHEGDLESARELVADEALADCGTYSGSMEDRDQRVTLRDVVTSGSHATVRVGIGSGYDGGLFGGTFEDEGEFVLERSGGDWLLVATPWGYDLCAVRSIR